MKLVHVLSQLIRKVFKKIHLHYLQIETQHYLLYQEESW